jgi:hypothetical protein
MTLKLACVFLINAVFATVCFGQSANFTVTTTGGTVQVSDSGNNSDTILISESAGGTVTFAAAGRTFSVDGGALTTGNSGPVAITGRISLSAGGGNDIINVGSFATPLPGLSLDGGAGNDTINLNGTFSLVAGGSLDLDLQDDAMPTGTDTVNVAANVTVSTSGAGGIVINVSRNISLGSGAKLEAEDGDIKLLANLQAVATAGTYAAINLAKATISTSGSGSILLNGVGGTTGSGNFGIWMTQDSTVTTTKTTPAPGTAGIQIVGKGGAGTANQDGVFLDGTSADPVISSAGGDISVLGTGGSVTGVGARGVVLNAGAQILAAGGGKIDVQGFGGINGTSSRRGVQVTGAGSLIAGVDGAITVTGTGGTGGSGSGNRGISIDNGGAIRSTGSGNVTLTGIEGAGTAPFDGIAIEGPNATVETSTGTGTMTFVADRMTLSPTAAIVNAGSNQVTLRPRTSGRQISLGGNDSGSELGLQDNELDRVTAGSLIIGDSTTGTIRQVNAITRSSLTHITLNSAGDIVLVDVNSGALDTKGGNLTLNAFAAVKAPGTGVDINTGGGNLSFASGSTLAFAINSAVPNTGYEQLNVAGPIDITSTSLSLSGSYTPKAGDIFVLLNNDGDDAIVGTFNGLAEKAIVNFKDVPMAISYVGGTGNDVTLSYAAPVLTVSKAAVTLLEGVTGTNSGTVSDLQNDVVSVVSDIGEVTANLATGNWTWQHKEPNGPAGPTTVTVTATDSSSPPQVTSITFTYTVSNVAPVAFPKTVNVFEDAEPFEIALEAADVEADSLVFTIVTPPASGKGTVAPVAGNTFLFTPASNVTGNVTFTFKATDNNGASSNVATVTVQFAAVNDAPKFVIGANRTHPPRTTAAQGFTGWATGIDDGDPEVTQTVAFEVTQIAGLSGLFTNAPAISSNGTLTYRPNGQSGWARFSVVLKDNGGTANGGIDTSAPQVFTIRIGHEQVINFPAIADKVFEDPPFALNATGGGSGQPITYAIVDGPATVDGNMVTITGAGLVTVRASQAAAGDYAQAEDVERTFEVDRAQQRIAFTNPGPRIFGEEPFALVATGGNSNLPVTFEVIDGPATVDGSTLTLTGIGTVIVRAKQDGNANYYPAPDVDVEFESEVFSDYTVITWGGEIRLYDNSGNSDLLEVTEPTLAEILFQAEDRTFSLNGGPNMNGGSGNLPLATADAITLHVQGGDDQVSIGAFANELPDLIINGGEGGDHIEFNGSITFEEDADLDVDLQNDHVVPGIDTITVDSGVSLTISGVGGVVFNASQSIKFATMSALSVEDGFMEIVANDQDPTPGSFIGVDINKSTIQVTGTGAMHISGRGGDSNSGSQIGIRVSAGSQVVGGGAGSPFILEGSGGASTGAGNHGVVVTGAGSAIKSDGADIEIIGTEGPGSVAVGFLSQTSGSVSTADEGGEVRIIANSVHIDATSSIVSPDAVQLAPRGGGMVVGSGMDVAGGPTQLSDAELDRVLTPNLIFGHKKTHTITVGGTVTRASLTNITFISQDDVVISGGPLKSAGGNVFFRCNGGVEPAFGGNEVDAGSGLVKLEEAEELKVAINGAVLNSGYQQLGVIGEVNLGGTSLQLTGSHVPAPGNVFILVNNDGVDPISGTFAGLPEGALFTFNGIMMQISYLGGSGNDVSLAYAAPVVAAHQSSRTANEGTAVTNSGTFSDLQGNATVTLTASIGSITQNNSAGTWSWTLPKAISSGVVTITATDNSVPPNESSVTFNLTVNNLPPLVAGQSVTILEDSVANAISVTASDPGDDDLTIVVVTPPPVAKGTLVHVGGKEFQFTPAPNTNGLTSFTFKAVDAEGAESLNAVVLIQVTPVNDAPTFVVGPDKVHLSTVTSPLAFPGWATSVSDGDPEVTQQLTFTVVESGVSGIFATPPAINSAGGLTYKLNGSVGKAILQVSLQDNGGTANGGVDTTGPQTFSIEVKDDIKAPTVTITAPLAGSRVPEGVVNVSGTAADEKAIQLVEVSLNSGPFAPATTNVAPSGKTATYIATISPNPGLNTIVVRSIDKAGNLSASASRSFTYVVMRPLTLAKVPANGGNVTILPALAGGQAQVGVNLTLKAYPATGFFWDRWSAPGVSSPADEAISLTIPMSEGLVITANFLNSPFTAGNFTGLAAAATGTTPSLSNFGLLTGSLSTGGVLTGKVNLGGTPTSFTAKFNHLTGDATGNNGGASPTLAYNLHLDLESTSNKITGTITKLAGGSPTDVCDVEADRAIFSASNPVPADLLKAGDSSKNGVYTLVFPARLSQDGLDSADYPQGDGFGTVSLSPSGAVVLGGVLADGTPITASVPLAPDFTFPLAVVAKASATTPAIAFGGTIAFDTSNPDSDLTGDDLVWFRGPRAAAPYYPDGWPAGIVIDLIGAKYAFPIGSAILPGLVAPSSGGNAQVQLSAGLLPAPIVKDLNIFSSNAIVKIPASDSSYTLALSNTTGTGTVSGNFAHPNSASVKPSIRATVLQKGASAGGYGFFLSPVSGESGRFSLIAK